MPSWDSTMGWSLVTLTRVISIKQRKCPVTWSELKSLEQVKKSRELL